MAVLTSLAVDHPTDPRTLNPALPRRLAELILRLLAKAPRDRPASALEVAGSLEDLVRRLEASRQAVRRRWQRAAVLSAVVIVLLVAAKVILRRPGPGSPGENPRRSERPTRCRS